MVIVMWVIVGKQMELVLHTDNTNNNADLNTTTAGNYKQPGLSIKFIYNATVIKPIMD